MTFKKFNLKIIIVCFFGYVIMTISSCCTIKIVKPIKLNDEPNIQRPEASYLGVKACISNLDFMLAVKNTIKNPIVSDDKPIKVVAEILATEDITFESLVNVMISPYMPGYWEDLAVKTYQTVRETFGCFIKPWKWGSCWKDVLKEVWVTTKIWVEPQLAIYEWQTVAVTKVIDKAYSPEVTIHYPTYLDDIQVHFDGNRYMIKGFTTTSVKIDVEGKVLPLTPEIKVKSLLNSDVKCEITLEGEINITEDKEVSISGAVTNFNIITPLDLLPKIGGKDFYQYIFQEIALQKLTEKFIEDLSKNSLQKFLDKLLERNNDKLNFKEKIDYVTQAMASPKEISQDIWLNFSPIEISSSQINGSGSDLCISIGLKFEPSIVYTVKPPSINPSSIPFRIQNTASSSTKINLRLSGSMDKIQSLVSDAVNKELVSSGSSILRNIYVKNVDLYRTEGGKIVIALDVYSKLNWLKCKVFSAYLISDLLYNDVTKQFSLSDVNFDVNTSSKLINSIYKEFIDKKIEKLIEDAGVFNIGSNYRKANDILANLDFRTDYGALSGKASLEKLYGPFVSNSTIDMYAKVVGDYVFKFSSKNSDMFASAYLPAKAYESLNFRNKTIDGVFLYNRNFPQFNSQIGKLMDDSTFERVRKFLIIRDKQRQDFSKYNHIDFDGTSYSKKNMVYLLPLKLIDDRFINKLKSSKEFVYIIDEKGNKIKKRRSFEDQIFIGENYIFIDKEGEIKMDINN